MARILIVEGNTREILNRMQELGYQDTAGAYGDVLKEIGFVDTIDIAYPGEEGANIDTPVPLSDYTGIAWTGSALNAYKNDDAIAINHQRDFALRAFTSGTPIFGSCWGMQIMAMALGGQVIKNPMGRELGVARNITVNALGQKHPMFAGRNIAYDQLSVHTDIVATAPKGAVVLSANENTSIQSMVIEEGGGTFWGVQYHPEFDFAYLSGILRRYGQRLVDDGYFKNLDDLHAHADTWQSIHDTPDDFANTWRYGFSADVTTPERRRLELINWLDFIKGR
ncbi:MAG: type 1 glutamine amidotransferase [Pseudomonadota bacterium]